MSIRQSLRKPAALAAALAVALLCAQEALAQGFPFDLFGDDRPRARRERAPPREWRRPDASRPKRSDGAKRREQATPGQPTGGASAQGGAEAPPPPYEPQMMRLTEILGALSFLRDLCGAGDGDDWRGKMSTLLNAEAPSGARRDKLTASFNRGFRGYELAYRACTPNAQLAISRYLDEAARLTRDITYRYGNP